MRRIIMPCIIYVFMVSSASAEELPKNAVPLTPGEIQKMYVGRTSDWSRSSVFFAADGSAKGYFGKPKIETTLKGNWEVKGNEICLNVKPKSSEKIFTDCWKHWRSGTVVYTLSSKRFDGKTVDPKSYYKGEAEKLKPGDQVSAIYAANGGL
jgi:hypothetical protein